MEIVFLIKELRNKGISLNLKGEEIEVLFLTDDVDTDSLALIKKNKIEIKEYLKKINAQEEFIQIPKAPEAVSYPVSNAQKRIWIASQIEEASIAYNMPFQIELKGEYDIENFRKAVDYVITRHEILRTIFKEQENDNINQIVLQTEELAFEIAYIDLSKKNNKELRLKDYIKEDSIKQFDLENGPLIRAALLKLEEDKYVFYYNIHHIISDGWSLGILARDVFESYKAFNNHKEPLLPELRIQYKDYAAWYVNQISQTQLSKQKEYWLGELHDSVAKFEFPTEKKRPSIRTYKGKRLCTYLSKELTIALREFSRINGGSLYMGILSSLRALLYRYTNQNDIIIGSPIAAREHSDLFDQIGFYVNTLAIRSEISGSETFNQLFSQVKETTLKAYENQQYPFDKLVEDLNINKDLSRHPVFDVMIVLQNDAKNNGDDTRDKLEDIVLEDNIYSKFDLLFNFEESEDHLVLNLEFNTDVYEENRIKQFVQHYKNILKIILESPEKPILEIDYLLDVEKKNILETFNCTKNTYPAISVAKMFEEQVIKTPNKKAIVFKEESLSYQELNTYSNQLAHCLKEKYGVCSGDKIGVVLERSIDTVVTMIGIQKLGACYVPIDYKYPTKRITHILNDASINLVISNNQLAEMDVLKEQEILNLTYKELSIYSHKNLAITNDLSNPSFVVYTSGSTGVPKGVLQTNKTLSNLIYWHINYSGIDKGLNHLQYASFSFDVSIQDCWFALNSGGTLYIVNEEIRLDFFELSKYILDNEIETISMPYAALSSLYTICTLEQFQGHSIKHISSSGEQLVINQSLHEFLEANPEVKLHNHYGPSETHVVTSHTMSVAENNLELYAPIGKPISNTNIYILDTNLNPVAIGVKGELYIGGDNLAIGYLNLLDETKNKFIENPFKKGEKLYKTGDYAFWRENGDILYKERKDDQVKVNGYRIELKEIERVLSTHLNINDAIVNVFEIEGEKRICAYITCKETQISFDLRRYLLKYLPQYMIPTHIVKLDRIPLTFNGKIDRKALPNPLSENFLNNTTYDAPESELEEALVAIWQNVLGIERIGVNDVIFELGGNSLIVVRIVNKIKQLLGYTITVAEIFENPTIKEIIPYLRLNSFDSIPKTQTSDLYHISSTQLRFWILSQNEKANVAYNIPLTVHIEGSLDVEVLEKSFKEVIKRHDSLRTCFVKDQVGEIKQDIKTIKELNFDIKSYKIREGEKVEELISKVNNTAFNLAQAPLLKVDLIQENEENYYLCFVMHHIIGDGRSIEILLKEIATCYNDLSNNRRISLPELNIQFKDYVAWSQNNQARKQAEKEKKYWLKELSGELPILNLPTYEKRPVIQVFEGESVSFKFKDEVFKKLKAFSKEHKTTLFMTLMASVNGLLSRYTNQTDIILGTPVLGRDHPDLENQVGLFINTLPIRTKFEQEDNFLRLLEIQKSILLKMYANTNYPFGDLINELNLKRDTSRSPIFDVLVIFQKQEEQFLNLSTVFQDVKCSMCNEVQSAVSKFDITFSFTEIQEGLELGVEYNSNLYEKEFIQNFIKHLEKFIEYALQNPSEEIYKIPFLTIEETNTILYGFNDTKVDYKKNDTFLIDFLKQVNTSPEKTALIYDNKTITYDELDKKSNQLANFINELGLKNEVIALCIDRSIEMVIGILGILKSENTYLPLDASYPISRLDFIIRDSNTSLVITKKDIIGFIPSDVKVVCFEDNVIWKGSNEKKLNLSSESIAYVIYTSGTTGKPKGVAVSHQNLHNFFIGLNQQFKLPEDKETWLAVTSINFDISILEILWTLTRGNEVAIQPDRPLAIEEMGDIDFSLFYFAAQEGVKTENKYNLLLKGARFADENELKAIWVPERHFHSFGDQFPNPSVAAAAVAATTKSINIRSGSVVLPLHNTVRVAEEWSMVDNLSEGRIELSIASGWHPNDFVLAPDDFKNRHQVMRDKIVELKKLWKGETIKRKNGVGQDFEFKIHPQPIQSDLKLWITAAGSIETFKYAGSIGANILTHLLGQSKDELKEKIIVYRKSLKENGFDPNNGKVALMLHTFVSQDNDYVNKVVEEPFKNYLKHSINLIKPLAEDANLDIEKDQDLLVEMGFHRFYSSSGLFGTPETCLTRVKEVYEIGVNEIACLIDYGIETDTTLANLPYLKELINTVKRQKKQTEFLKKRYDQEWSVSKLISQNKVTNLQTTPSLIQELLLDNKGKEALQQIKTLLVGGEPLVPALAKELLEIRKKPIFNMYGPTETTIWSTVKKVEIEDNVNIGKPISNTQVYVLDTRNQLCPIGVVGELCIGGDGVSLGYIGRKELNEIKFIPNSFTENKNQKLYKTGDYARWLSNGELECLGRVDNQIKINGYRIELEEIENTINAVPGIIKSVVIFNKNQNLNSLVAYIKVTDMYDKNALVDYLKTKLPQYMIPNHTVVLDDFPLTLNGKIDTKLLHQMKVDTTSTLQYEPPRNDLDKELTDLWREVLNRESIGINDDFFELGGNSIKGLSLIHQINDKYDIELGVQDIFKNTTVASISNIIEEKRNTISEFDTLNEMII